jgi:hypothetical protein
MVAHDDANTTPKISPRKLHSKTLNQQIEFTKQCIDNQQRFSYVRNESSDSDMPPLIRLEEEQEEISSIPHLDLQDIEKESLASTINLNELEGESAKLSHTTTHENELHNEEKTQLLQKNSELENLIKNELDIKKFKNYNISSSIISIFIAGDIAPHGKIININIQDWLAIIEVLGVNHIKSLLIALSTPSKPNLEVLHATISQFSNYLINNQEIDIFLYSLINIIFELSNKILQLPQITAENLNNSSKLNLQKCVMKLIAELKNVTKIEDTDDEITTKSKIESEVQLFNFSYLQRFPYKLSYIKKSNQTISILSSDKTIIFISNHSADDAFIKTRVLFQTPILKLLSKKNNIQSYKLPQKIFYISQTQWQIFSYLIFDWNKYHIAKYKTTPFISSYNFEELYAYSLFFEINAYKNQIPKEIINLYMTHLIGICIECSKIKNENDSKNLNFFGYMSNEEFMGFVHNFILQTTACIKIKKWEIIQEDYAVAFSINENKKSLSLHANLKEIPQNKNTIAKITFDQNRIKEMIVQK